MGFCFPLLWLIGSAMCNAHMRHLWDLMVLEDGSGSGSGVLDVGFPSRVVYCAYRSDVDTQLVGFAFVFKRNTSIPQTPAHTRKLKLRLLPCS